MYEGVGSTYYSPSGGEKEESNLTKVAGMASNLFRGIANKIKTKDDGLLDASSENQYQNYENLAYSDKPESKPQTAQS